MTNERDKRKAEPTAFPITTKRFTPLPSRKTLPPKRDDEMAVAIAKRDEQIKLLLRREFGTLAPPPLPNVLRAPSSRDAEARIRQGEIESRRKEYEDMDAASLQFLVDKANTESVDEARERAAQAQSLREARWPHWAKKDLWSEAEFAALCCGVVPDERGMTSDPGKTGCGDVYAVAIHRAADDIRRGTLSKTLAFVPRDDADTASRMYGTARHYVPAIAAEWAAQRFDAFPAKLLDALRASAKLRDKPAKVVATTWPWGDHETELLRKLAAAADRFWKLYDPSDATTAPTNEAVIAWLKQQGVAERNAQVMATILRANNLPTGPRR